MAVVSSKCSTRIFLVLSLAFICSYVYRTNQNVAIRGFTKYLLQVLPFENHSLLSPWNGNSSRKCTDTDITRLLKERLELSNAGQTPKLRERISTVNWQLSTAFKNTRFPTLRRSGPKSQFVNTKASFAGGSANKTILLLTGSMYFPKGSPPPPYSYGNDHISRTCHFTTDVKFAAEVDAIIFHVRCLTSVNLVYQHIHGRRRPDQPWIILNQESPAYSPGASPTFQKVMNEFNYTAHYSMSSDIVIPYGECRHLRSIVSEPLTEISRNQLAAILNSRQQLPLLSHKVKEKDKLVLWFVSNCRTISKREKYVEELGKHIRVDVYGRCGSMGRIERVKGAESKVMRRYKFYLSFENSLCKEYVTEKVYKVLMPDQYVVPVVLGLGPYEKALPPNSYIDIRNFTSPQALASYLKRLDKNEEEYKEYFEWRKHYGCVRTSAMKRLCDAVHAVGFRKHSTNLADLESKKSSCVSSEIFFKNRL